MSQDQQQSSEPAAAPAEPTAPSIYTAAEIRSNILAKTGAQDMGAFHPAAPKMAAPGETPVDVEPTAPAAPAAQAQGGDVAAELAAMRAEVAALRQSAMEPDAEPEQPATAVHPLEPHAKQVLGPGAKPHHLERAVKLLEQGMQWRQFIAHHEANQTPEGAAERAKAQRAMDAIQREIEGLSEIAQLHAEVAALREQTSKPTPEQRKQQRAGQVEAVLANADIMGKHHPALLKAMQANETLRGQVHAYLLSLPDDEHFAARGDAYLHSLDAAYAAAMPAPQPPKPVAPPPAQRPTPSVRPPVQVQAIGEGQPFLTRRDFWARVQNGFEARGKA